MYSNYKFISYEKLLEEVNRNCNIIIETKNKRFEHIKVKSNNNILAIILSIIRFENEEIYIDPYIYRGFIALLENNLIYKHNNIKDDWKEEPKIQLYMHNKELFNKLYK